MNPLSKNPKTKIGREDINIETNNVTLKNGKRVAQYKLIKEAK